MKKHKNTIITVACTGFLVTGLMAFGVTADSIGDAGKYFIAVRIALYLSVFVFFFESFTAPMLIRITQNVSYVDVHARPRRFRCLFWLLLIEAFLLIPWM